MAFDKFLDIFRSECCPIDSPNVPITLAFVSSGLFGVAEKIVAPALVDVTEMFDDAFAICQCDLKLCPEACPFKKLLFGLFDQLWGDPTVMHDPVASLAEEL